MLARLLDLSLRQRIIMLVMTAILTALHAFRTMPIDAFPDVTPILVQVVTKVPGFSPAEIERFVMFPLELQLTGTPPATRSSVPLQDQSDRAKSYGAWF